MADDSKTLSFDLLARDPLAAIYAPLPEKPSFELLNAALGVATAHWSEDTDLGRAASSRVTELFKADECLLANTGEIRAPLGANPTLWAAATASAEIEDEEKKRSATQSIDAGNPANMELGANIRPDVGSAPGGLVTYTTQKSSTYEANSADEGKVAEKPTMTLEAITRDPWNAVELPLPQNASQDLLIAARDAADHFVHLEHHLMEEARAGRNTDHWSPELHAAGEPQPDAHEYNEDRWLQALTRFELISEHLAEQQGEAQQQGDGLTPPEVAEAAPLTASERQAARLEALHATERARREERAASSEEITPEEGQQISRDLGGGISM